MVESVDYLISLINSGRVMIKVLTKEYREGDQAVKTTEVTFLHIILFKYKKSTTNNKAVELLTSIQQSNKVIKGFI